MRKPGRSILIMTLLAAASCSPSRASQFPTQLSPTDSRTACSPLIPQCRAKRLPDVILKGGQTSGALGSVERFDLTGIISFDQAMLRAWQEDRQEAKTVQVILGSAVADKLGWGHGRRLFYAIDWGGVCVRFSEMARPSPHPPSSCSPRTWGTVIDAKTGAFIVGGA
jgi:hypothetical protein